MSRTGFPFAVGSLISYDYEKGKQEKKAKAAAALYFIPFRSCCFLLSRRQLTVLRPVDDASRSKISMSYSSLFDR